MGWFDGLKRFVDGLLPEDSLIGVPGIALTSRAFRRKLIAVCERQRLNPDYLAAVIAFETAGTFDPAQPNLGGSGAVGLIQFMPGKHGSAAFLGTTTERLALMTAEEQLDFVELYFRAIVRTYGFLVSLEDHYLAVIYGKVAPPGKPLFQSPSREYVGNVALDSDGNGEITALEATSAVRRLYEAALRKRRVSV